jgi:hypothetical protein
VCHFSDLRGAARDLAASRQFCRCATQGPPTPADRFPHAKQNSGEGLSLPSLGRHPLAMDPSRSSAPSGFIRVDPVFDLHSSITAKTTDFEKGNPSATCYQAANFFLCDTEVAAQIVIIKRIELAGMGVSGRHGGTLVSPYG